RSQRGDGQPGRAAGSLQPGDPQRLVGLRVGPQLDSERVGPRGHPDDVVAEHGAVHDERGRDRVLQGREPHRRSASGTGESSASASTGSRPGTPSVAPVAVVASAPAAFASSAERSSVQPRSLPYRSPATKASPAPVPSIATTACGGTYPSKPFPET